MGKIRHVRCSANPLFTTAAKALDGDVVAVVLSGGNRDATDGVQSVREAGGIVLVQDCDERGLLDASFGH
jgi:two-component system chemotaxis response regulator CheB